MGLEVFLKAFREEHWQRYLEVCSKSNVKCNIQLEDHSIDLPEDIGLVLCYIFGNYLAAKWLYKQISVIDDIQPIKLLKSESGKNILRELLMRMPD